MNIDKIDQIEEILEKRASDELKRATAYHNGYMQACEDFARSMRAEIIEEEN